MKTEFLYSFISKQRYAVLASVTAKGDPEAALVGFAVAPDLRLIFDTVSTSRKYKNLIQNGAIALVIGWNDDKTVQYEGRVKILEGTEFDNMRELYELFELLSEIELQILMKKSDILSDGFYLT